MADQDTEEQADDLKTSVYSDDKAGTSPLGVVRRDPEPDEIEDILDFAATELGLIYGTLDQERLNQQAVSNEKWRWEDYQLRYFNSGRFWIANKPRQTGISAAFGAKALARGILAKGNYTGIFVSYKKEEAINKINYVKAFLDALPLQFAKKIIRDPLHLIEWRNPNGTISKIISHAQKPVRGHHGDAWLDEFHFFQQDKLIYDSVLPVVAQVNGTIDIASTPFGKAGVFYDIVSDPVSYPRYTREWIYWWWCLRYLKEPTRAFLEHAMVEAPKIKKRGGPHSSEEIINRFGNDKILAQFENLDLETFQQEFEGLFVDEQAFFFSRALIMKSMYDHRTHFDEYDPRESDFINLDGSPMSIEEALRHEQFHIEREHPDVYFKRYNSREGLIAAIRSGKITPNLYAGVDVGATRHSSDIRILEELPMMLDGRPTTLQVERFAKNENKWPLENMQQWLIELMRTGIIRKMNIDGTGIGYHMAQTLENKFKGKVKSLKMNGAQLIRSRVMSNLKNRMEGNGLALAYDKQTIEDLHSIKTAVSSAGGRPTFRTEERGLHHGDGAWSLSFGSFAGTEFGKPPRVALTAGTSIQRPGYQRGTSKDLNAEQMENISSDRQVKKHLKTLKSNKGSLKNGSLNTKGRGRQGVKDLFSRLDPGDYIKDYDR